MLFVILSILGIALLVNLGLGIFVFLKNRHSLVNILFSLFVLGIVGWGGTIFALLGFGADLLTVRLTFSFAALMLISFLLFSLVFPEKGNPKKLIFYLLAFLGVIFFTLPLLGDLIVNSVSVEKTFIAVGFGSLYPLYGLFAPFCIIGALIILIKKYFSSAHAPRLQLKYLFLGGTLFLVPAVFTNLLLPSLFNIWDFNGLGPAFSFFMVLATSYAIVRHHLMDISVIIRLGTIYGVLFAIISFIFVSLAGFVGQFTSGWFAILLPSLFITFGFMPLKTFIETTTDSIFFRKKYRVADIIDTLNKIIHEHSLNLDDFLENFNKLIIDSMRIQWAAILILIPKGDFVTRQIIGGKLQSLEFKPDHPFILYFKENKNGVIDRESLRGDQKHSEIIKELDRLDCFLVVPIESKGKIIGLHLIGKKKSQDQFSKEDIDLLELVAGESAFAIDNARLFDELQKIDQTKSKFISVVSHQLRTPLTSIHWNLELILGGDIDKKTATELSKNARESAFTMATALDDMFTALDIDEGRKKTEPKKIPTDIKSTIDHVLIELEEERKKRNITVKTEWRSVVPPFPYDPTMIEKVVQNVFRNALLYSPAGSEVHISVEKKEINEMSYMVFSIIDSGIGITEEEKKDIFSRFYRGEHAKGLSPNGFGLSLFIAKYFVEQHGGELWFISQGKNKGAEFFFSLPTS